MEKTYLKMQYEEYYTVEDMTSAVHYFNDRLDYSSLVEKIEELLNIKEVEFKPVQALLNFYKQEKRNLTALKIELSHGYFYEAFDEDLKITDKLEDILTTLIDWYELDTYLYEMFSSNELQQFISSLGLQFGTVGYSQWGYYIALDNIEYSFIRDIYEGNNIYNLSQLDENGDIVDSLGLCYITDDKELKEMVNDYFNTENIEVCLVDNNESTYFEAYPKVQQITHETYTFEEI